MKHEIDPISSHIWFLQETSGKLIKMSVELDKLLNEKSWQALSSTSRAGHLNLVLTAYKDERIDRITEVELDQKASIHCLKNHKVEIINIQEAA